MRYLNGLLLTIALLLAACAPASMAQTATAESTQSTIPLESNQSTPAPVNTPVPTVEDLSEIPVPPTVPVTTNTEANVATTITNTPATASVASSPAAVAQSAPPEQDYENLTSPVDLLASYYNAVNRQEYERAYRYWQEAPLDYASFANGYADTASVQLIVQPPTRTEGAAGSLYVEIPTVLIAQHHDGSTHTFAGCLVTRKSNLRPPDIPEEDVWHLYQARISEVDNNSSIPTLLAQGCQS